MKAAHWYCAFQHPDTGASCFATLLRSGTLTVKEEDSGTVIERFRDVPDTCSATKVLTDKIGVERDVVQWEAA